MASAFQMIICTALILTSLLSIFNYVKVENQLKDLKAKSVNEQNRNRRDVEYFPQTVLELEELIYSVTNQSIHDEIEKVFTNVFINLPIKKLCKYVKQCPSNNGGQDGSQGPQGPPGLPGKQGPKGDDGQRGLGLYLPILKENRLNQVVNQTDNATFECQFFGNPIPEVKWTSPSKKAQYKISYKVNRDKSLVTSFLEIKNITWGDRGNVSCKAESILGNAEGTGELSVHAVPIISLNPRLVMANTGSNFEFPECKVLSNPPAKILWKRGFGDLPYGRTQIKNDILTITKLRVEDEGYYVCVAENYLGKAVASIQLKSRPLTFQTRPSFVIQDVNNSLVLCSAFGVGQNMDGRIMMISDEIIPYTVNRTNRAIEISAELTVPGLYKCEINDGQEKIVTMFKLEIFSLESSSLSYDKVEQIGRWLKEEDALGKYALCYKGSRDNWSSSKFLSQCGGKENTLSIFQSQRMMMYQGYVFGGYADIPWTSIQHGSTFSQRSFLFKFKNGAMKIPLNNTSKVLCYKPYGPCFGDNGLFVKNRNYRGYGNMYHVNMNSIDSSLGNDVFTGFSSGQLLELEVFYRVN